MANQQDGESVILAVWLPVSRHHLRFTEEAAMQECSAYRASTPPCPHAMLSTKSIIFLFDRLKHKGWRVYGLLNGWQLSVFFEVNATISAQ